MPANPDDLDLVDLLKQEWETSGGDPLDEVPFPSPIESEEDAIRLAAIFVHEAGRTDKSVAIWANDGELRFKDVNNQGNGISLQEITSDKRVWSRHFLLMGG